MGILTRIVGPDVFIMPGIPLSSRADALTVTTRKDRSLKCIAPDNMATPDLCGKWVLLLYAACFCRSHYISLKIRYRGKQWEKKSYSQDPIYYTLQLPEAGLRKTSFLLELQFMVLF